MHCGQPSADLRGLKPLIGERLTIGDFSIGALVPTAQRLQLPIGEFPEIVRWYKGLATLPGWKQAVATKDAAMAAWQSQRGS